MEDIIELIKIETGLLGCSTYDKVIKNHISTVRTICKDAGIALLNIEQNPLFISLCVMYSKTFIGYKQDGSVRELPGAFTQTLCQLKLGGKK